MAAAAQAYIVGHELGHHVQRLAEVASHVAALNQRDPDARWGRLAVDSIEHPEHYRLKSKL